MTTQTVKAYQPEIEVTEVPSIVSYLVILAGVIILAIGMVAVSGM